MAGVQVEEAFKVRHQHGLHARPAGEFVSIAGKFESEVSVSSGEDDEWVSGCSVLSLLSLAAEHGTMLRIRAVGGDAEHAVSALGKYLEAGVVGAAS